jgi:pimeloyl-ACP methyl ester carboxylesterase
VAQGATRAGPTPRSVDLDGPVFVEEWSGPGERTFVLIHGLGGSHLNWRRVAPGLARLGRVLALDLPGFGRSPLAERRATLAANRQLLSRFIESEADGEVVLAGNSMGGGLALLQAAHEPGSLAGVVPTSAIFPWAWSRGEGRGLGAYPSMLVTMGFSVYRSPLGPLAVGTRFHRLDPDQAVRMSMRATMVDPSCVPEELVREHAELLRERRNDPDGPRAFVDATRSLLPYIEQPGRTREVLDSVKVPTLVVHGTADRFVPVAFAEAAVRANPEWSYRFLPGVGHAPQLEAPERWLAAVEEWLPR